MVAELRSVLPTPKGVDNAKTAPPEQATKTAKGTSPADLKYLQYLQTPLVDKAIPVTTAKQLSKSQTADSVVYVLYAGMQGSNGKKAHEMRDQLIQQGISASQIVIPEAQCHPDEHPYPVVINNGIGAVRNFVTNLYSYWQLQDPQSRTSQDAYRRLCKALPKSSDGKPVTVHFISYSGGAQQAGTMAHLLTQNRSGQNYVDSLTALGAPWISNNTPKHVKLHDYVSKADNILYWTSWIPFVRRIPPKLDDNDQVFHVPNVSHCTWTTRSDIFRQIVENITRKEPEKKQAPPAQFRTPRLLSGKFPWVATCQAVG